MNGTVYSVQEGACEPVCGDQRARSGVFPNESLGVLRVQTRVLMLGN